jgi:hypothetical protein
MKQFLLAPARHKTATVLTVLALVVSTTVLVAQQPRNVAAPAESGYSNSHLYDIDQFHKEMRQFIANEEIHEKATLLSGELLTMCNDAPCKRFILSFIGASNTPLIPDRVIFLNKEDKSFVGGLDSRDFEKGVHTQFELPVGEYIMIAQHHMYEDYINDRLSVTTARLNEIGYEHNISMTLSNGTSSPSESFMLKTYPDGLHIMGVVRDVQTGLPLKGVRVSVSKFYPNYQGNTDVYAVSDEFGYYFSENSVNFATDTSNLEVISKYSGNTGIKVIMDYKLSEYESIYPDELNAVTFEVGTNQQGLFGFGAMKKVGVELEQYPRTNVMKLRKIKNLEEFLTSQKSLLSCTLPLTIRVGINCTSCGSGGGCSVYTYSGSSSLPVERYVTTVLRKEWGSTWGTIPGGGEALRAGSIAIRTMACKYIATPLTSSYDIGGDICWQVFVPSYYASLTTNPNSYPDQTSAVTGTAGWILKSGSTFPKSEYAAETNDYIPVSNGVPTVNCNSNYSLSNSCGNGKFQKSNNGYSGGCYPTQGIDFVSLGYCDCQNSHPRGMSQRGSFRWATGRIISNSNTISSSSNLPTMHNNIAYCKKTWQQILAHYYPYYTLENCSTGSTIALSGVSQVCGVNLTHNSPTFTRSNRTFNLTCKVKNNGGASSGQFYSRFYLSTNATYSSNDILIGNFTTSSTTSGSAATGTLSTTVSATTAPAGTYYLIFFVDATNTVSETSEATSDNVYVFPTPFTLGTSFAAENPTDGETEIQTVSDESLLDILNVEPSSDHCSVQTRGRAITVSCDDAIQCRIYDIQGIPLNVIEIDKQNYQCTVPTTGVYLVVSIDTDGHRHVYKVMIFD